MYWNYYSDNITKKLTENTIKFVTQQLIVLKMGIKYINVRKGDTMLSVKELRIHLRKLIVYRMNKKWSYQKSESMKKLMSGELYRVSIWKRTTIYISAPIENLRLCKKHVNCF